MAARKAPAKKPKAAAKAPAKAATKTTAKTATAKPGKKLSAVKEKYSKSQILNHLAEKSELSRKQVSSILDELGGLIEAHISKRGCGEFVLPGLLKIATVKKPARKARKGINPFTGEETTFAAKPASVQVKIRPLKKLKEMTV